jgi:hypothetical protein
MKAADGSRYEGEFQKHKRHGKGVLTSATGDVYTGDWVCNLREGEVGVAGRGS